MAPSLKRKGMGIMAGMLVTGRNSLRLVWLVCLAFGALLSACKDAIVETEAFHSPIITPRLTVFTTPTPSSTPTLLPPLIEIPLTPTPTPTPFTHTVVNNDTLLGIAIQYGVSLEELMAANPGVEPRLLSVGALLVIPLGGEIPVAELAATPAPLSLSLPRCYNTGEGGAWCLLLVSNPFTMTVENLSAWMGLYSTDGESLAGKVAIPPLNVLIPGGSLPLAAYFPPPIPVGFVPRVELVTALTMEPGEVRYSALSALVTRVELAPDGKQAVVSGEAAFTSERMPENYLWLALVGYDSEGGVAGVRKLAFAEPCPSAPEGEQVPMTCGPIPFEGVVFSLGSPIVRVEVLAEAR